MQLPELKALTWGDVREKVHALDPTLAQLIDDISPDDSLKIYRARYPYGELILHNGTLLLPDPSGQKYISLMDYPDKSIQKDLSYNHFSNPITMVTHGSTELYYPIDDRLIPLYGLINKGKLFGTWQILSHELNQHPLFLWHMSSGARSIFMLPKISNKLSHARLKKAYNLKAEKPASLLDHWQIFKEIAAFTQNSNPWYSELLFFPRAWIDKIVSSKSTSWSNLHKHLLTKAWYGSEHQRSQFIWDIAFSLFEKEKQIKPMPYIVDIVKHLISVGLGSSHGAAPALDETAAPIDQIQKAYLEEYGLKDYAPTLVTPKRYDASLSNDTTYYSLQFQMATKFSPKSVIGSSTIVDLEHVSYFLERLLKYLQEDKLKMKTPVIERFLTKTEINFFHSSADNGHYRNIRNSSDIEQMDPMFKLNGKYPENAVFPENAPFLRGCIRFSTKSDK